MEDPATVDPKNDKTHGAPALVLNSGSYMSCGSTRTASRRGPLIKKKRSPSAPPASVLASVSDGRSCHCRSEKKKTTKPVLPLRWFKTLETICLVVALGQRVEGVP